MSKESMTVIDRIRICEMRGQTVVLDSDLATIYGVTTGNFNKAVGRNLERFPEDFTFILSPDEFEALIFQIGTSKGRGGRRKLPRVFTEHGAIMAATVLNSPCAVAMSVYVVRAFGCMRNARGRAQHGMNPETGGACAHEWEALRPQVLTLAEVQDRGMLGLPRASNH